MDETVAKQLVHQLKIINFWVTFFGITFLILFAIIGYFIFRVGMAVKDTEQKFTTFQQQTGDALDVKDNLCKSDMFSGSDYCKE